MSFHKLLLGRGDVLNHDTSHGVQSGVNIGTRFLPHAVSHVKAHSHGSFEDSFTISSNLTCSVYVGVCFAMVQINVGNTNGGHFGMHCTTFPRV